VSGNAYPIVRKARIVQLTAAPGPLADDEGNLYCGWALCEFEVAWSDGEDWETVRDIFPFGADGGIIGCPPDAYYLLHGFGDDRAPFADFIALREAA
jgi:hypothetical protein